MTTWIPRRPREQPGHRSRGGAAVEKDRVAVLHVRTAARAIASFCSRKLSRRISSDSSGSCMPTEARAAIGAHDQPLVGERAQIAPHGGFGHAEMLAQGAYVVHAGQDGLQHCLAAVRNFHGDRG